MAVTNLEYDIAVIGGGTAGLAAAIAARRQGVARVVILETDGYTGGVLNQCIHTGFGLHTFNEELTGPEYAARFAAMAEEAGVELKLGTPVLSVSHDRIVTAVCRDEGFLSIHAGAVIVATGCRERSAGSISIPGARPAGVMTAGTAQRYINIEGFHIGRRIVTLGSGDIGLIMARRLTLEGAKVLCVAELMPYSNGLTRNVVQCLEDFDIPLYLSHTVTRIDGAERVTGVELSRVDDVTHQPIPGTGRYFECDTLLLSVGLIPEAELVREQGGELAAFGGIAVDSQMESTLPGIFACGNVVQVHDLVDFVAIEGERAGLAAARFVMGKTQPYDGYVQTQAGENVSFVVPARVAPEPGQTVEFTFRVRRPITAGTVHVCWDMREIYTKKRPYMLPGEMEKLSFVLPEGPKDAVLSVSVSEPAVKE